MRPHVRPPVNLFVVAPVGTTVRIPVGTPVNASVCLVHSCE